MANKGGGGCGLFRYADGIDKLLLFFGTLGSIGDGMMSHVNMYILSGALNDYGSANQSFSNDVVDKYALRLLYSAIGVGISAFIGNLYVTSDVHLIQDTIADKIPNCLAHLTSFISSLVVFFKLSWQLTLASLPFALMFIIPGLGIGKALMNVGTEMKAAYGNAGGIAEQGFTKGLLIGSMGMIYAAWAFQAWVGGVLVTEKGENDGAVFVAGICIILGGLAVMSALPNLSFISEARHAALKIYEMIDRNPNIHSENGKEKLLSHMVGLVGGSGLGKSTTISLLERFYDPINGDILLDGRNIKTLQLKWLRSQMGLVNQEPILFATSIKENFLFGKEGASMELVVQVAKAANGHDFIAKLPDGYETQVSHSRTIRASVIRRAKAKDRHSKGTDLRSEDPSSQRSNEKMVELQQTAMQNEASDGSFNQLECRNNFTSRTPGTPGTLVSIRSSYQSSPAYPLSPAYTFTPVFSFTVASSIDMHSNENRSDMNIKDSSNPQLSAWRLFRMNAPEWKRTLLGCIGFFANLLQHYNFAVMGERLVKRVREKTLAKVLTFEVGWFDRDEKSSAAVCARLSTEAGTFRSFIADRMSLLPLLIGCFYSRTVLMKSMSEKAQKAQNEGSQLASEAIVNHRTITAFSSQKRILYLFMGTMKGPRQQSVRQGYISGFGLFSSQFLTTASIALTFWYGGRLINQGLVTPKHLFQAFFILMSTGKNIADTGSMTSDLAKGGVPLNGFLRFLTGEVRLSLNMMIFRGLSHEIEAGKTMALVGQSGSGKSTNIGLIERFYDPQSGSVFIDGHYIKSYDLRNLRSRIALVSQEPTLFADTIRQNIAYGLEEADEAEIRGATKLANAHEFISAMKDGYETHCGERGAKLSGGQKQRIALARAILKNPLILLLDEATSALDSESESLVHKALEKMMVGRTCVVVAHRLSTIQKADSIAEIKNGKLVEQGSHSGLLGMGRAGAYYSLIKLQNGQSPCR
ncbi:putative F-box and wd40 domain protein [Hibiscus syriacus]|uniref:F-box and wd40 domain protein n=1 Tax=Hibiscus syriacus TaxID=106335 RepID=A0A6A2XCL2_HIBSY|nr:putative F-box and wd40 domain protein [Hibiscus syriacus]